MYIYIYINIMLKIPAVFHRYRENYLKCLRVENAQINASYLHPENEYERRISNVSGHDRNIPKAYGRILGRGTRCYAHFMR